MAQGVTIQGSMAVTLNGPWKLQNVDCWVEWIYSKHMQSPCSAQRNTLDHTHTPKNKHTTSISIQYPCHKSQGITSQNIKTNDTNKVLTTLESWNGGFSKKGIPFQGIMFKFILDLAGRFDDLPNMTCTSYHATVPCWGAPSSCNKRLYVLPERETETSHHKWFC